MTTAFETDIVIAGAGPVGAVTALRLAKMGLRVLLMESEADCPEDMRASTLHPPSLEMLDELGLTELLIPQGLKSPVYQYRNRRTGRRIELDLGELADMTPFPYRLQCEQFKIARTAIALLEQMPNAEVRFNRQLLSFDQDADGVTVFFESPMAIEPVRCGYLIGSDGANSTVRKWLGVDFEGFTYPEKFLTLSTAFPLEEHLEGIADVNYVADAKEWCVILKVPGLWRILVPVHDELSNAEIVSDAKKDAVFTSLLGEAGRGIHTYHRTIYRVHQRVASAFHVGRVLLAGDAAHLNNPLGGFGMNSGIHDGWNLAERLRRIYQEGADAEAELSQYDRQRRAVASGFVQTQTQANKKMLEAAEDGEISVMEKKLSNLAQDAEARREYMIQQAMFRSLELERATL